MQVKFFDIDWDKDGATVDLPQDIVLTVDDDVDLESDGADELSNKFGFCVNSFNFRIV